MTRAQEQAERALNSQCPRPLSRKKLRNLRWLDRHSLTSRSKEIQKLRTPLIWRVKFNG